MEHVLYNVSFHEIVDNKYHITLEEIDSQSLRSVTNNTN